jgi:signal transduction histidine kinase
MPQLINILRAFHSITEKIVEYDEDLQELLQAILDLMVPFLDASYAAILLLDEEQRHFYTIATHGDLPVTLNLEAVIDVSKIAASYTGPHQTLPVPALVNDSLYGRLNPEQQRHLSDVLCSPLAIQHKIIGVACIYAGYLNLDNLKSEEFSLWLNLASLAVEKSRLHNVIHKRLAVTCEDLRRTQSQLIRSEKLNALAEIGMSVAHAIRNPVTVIGGLSIRMHKALPEDDPKRLWSQMILSEASRLESIVNEFKSFFSINQISFSCEDMNRLVNQTADDFVSEAGLGLDFTIRRFLCNEPLICRVDTDLIRRCLMHLFGNAREATRTRGHITVATNRRGNEAIVDVTDSGRGMPREEMRHAFDPFYTTKSQGAGMGLTFVHFVVSEHAGKIAIKSEEGVGTRFRIRLPLAPYQKFEKNLFSESTENDEFHLLARKIQ